ncbi:MAG: DUF2058 domain-containing protein [Pseudomonadota bacterium]|nr:DUF2058 domain-containing protein [Pseudomonadota bacterium]
MRNPLQEQLLKAGLIKKSKAAELAREQARQRKGKAPPPADEVQVDAKQLQAERAERDRALSAEHNAQARQHEQQAQVRQIVEAHRIKREGEIPYGFNDGGRIRRLLVSEALRSQLAKGALVIVRHHDGYELLPRVAAEKVYARDPSMIVLDHGRSPQPGDGDGDGDGDGQDPYYDRFKVPDDLVW